MNRETAVETRSRVCGRKARYAAEAARKVADDYTANREPGEKVTTAYRCPFCRSWHVGHLASVETLQVVADSIRWLAQNPEEDPWPSSTQD